MSYPPQPTPQPTPPPSNDTPLRASTNIQGKILAAFNKDHAVFLFVELSAGTARGWLGDLVPLTAVTKEVEDFNEEFSAKRHGDGQDPTDMHAQWVGLGFTVDGLQKLTIDAQRLTSDLRQFAAFVSKPNNAQRAEALGDKGASAPARWLFESEARTPVDAVVTLEADRPDDLRALESEIEAINNRHGVSVIFRQPGETLPESAKGHEHFGFKDGISQPGVRQFHKEDPQHPGQRLGHPGQDLIAPGEFVLGYPDQRGETTPTPEWMRDGSFQVYRRLAQDVPGFSESVEQQQRNVAEVDPEKLGAKLVGRWRSGASLAQNPDNDPHPGANAPEDNDFGYQADDSEGAKTPRFAHIRKVYPRDAQPPGDQASEEHRILRRGIPFGPPFDPTGGSGDGVDEERGLNFVCFQASIENQFEFLQEAWANGNDFPRPGDGPDPVIGNNDAGNTVTLHTRDGQAHRLAFARFVSTQAAVYAFNPSKAALAQFAQGQL